VSQHNAFKKKEIPYLIFKISFYVIRYNMFCTIKKLKKKKNNNNNAKVCLRFLKVINILIFRVRDFIFNFF